ncbi:hypothetical protein MBLNU230_g2563t1 [Neophaeotheca triangularis]
MTTGSTSKCSSSMKPSTSTEVKTITTGSSSKCSSGMKPSTSTEVKTITTGSASRFSSSMKPSTSTEVKTITTGSSSKCSSSTKPSTTTDVKTHYTSSCASSTVPMVPMSSVCTTSSQPAVPQNTCPGELQAGSYEFPHLLIPVDSAKPHECYGTQFNITASDSISTIANFDVPASAKGMTCKLEFLFPEQHQLETSAYTFSGSGKVSFKKMTSPAKQHTTYHNMPKCDKNAHNEITVAPGNAYDVEEFPCPAGETMAVMMSPEDDTCLSLFQDVNPCPIGLYLTMH